LVIAIVRLVNARRFWDCCLNVFTKRHGTPLAAAVLYIFRTVKNAVNKITGNYALVDQGLISAFRRKKLSKWTWSKYQ